MIAKTPSQHVSHPDSSTSEPNSFAFPLQGSPSPPAPAKVIRRRPALVSLVTRRNSRTEKVTHPPPPSTGATQAERITGTSALHAAGFTASTSRAPASCQRRRHRATRSSDWVDDDVEEERRRQGLCLSPHNYLNGVATSPRRAPLQTIQQQVPDAMDYHHAQVQLSRKDLLARKELPPLPPLSPASSKPAQRKVCTNGTPYAVALPSIPTAPLSISRSRRQRLLSLFRGPRKNSGVAESGRKAAVDRAAKQTRERSPSSSHLPCVAVQGPRSGHSDSIPIRNEPPNQSLNPPTPSPRRAPNNTFRVSTPRPRRLATVRFEQARRVRNEQRLRALATLEGTLVKRQPGQSKPKLKQAEEPSRPRFLQVPQASPPCTPVRFSKRPVAQTSPAPAPESPERTHPSNNVDPFSAGGLDVDNSRLDPSMGLSRLLRSHERVREMAKQACVDAVTPQKGWEL